MVSGTFKASRLHDNQPAETAYALVLNFPENDIMEKVEMGDKKIKLKGNFTPTEEEMKASEVSKEYYVPFLPYMILITRINWSSFGQAQSIKSGELRDMK
ncbi:MAG: hypothetical protein IPH31_17640 [Lewinellaceae bacterium]|nr:hypothetical protein [Lewinellaceae bacterium]